VATTAEQVSEALAILGGELRTELATLTGSVNNLATEVRLGVASQARTDAAHDATHVEQARQIGLLQTDVQGLKNWQIEVMATERSQPRLTWPAFFRDAKSGVLALLMIASLIWGFTR